MPVPADPTTLFLTHPMGVFASSVVRLGFVDNATDELGFKVERKIGAGAFVEIATLGPSANTGDVNFDDKTGEITPGSSVTYRVKAFNASGDSGYSNTPTAVTLG